jgi:hypothetical protein
MREGLAGCYSWEPTFTAPPNCGGTSGSGGQSSCPDATWFWVLAAVAAGYLIFKKN